MIDSISGHIFRSKTTIFHVGTLSTCDGTHDNVHKNIVQIWTANLMGRTCHDFAAHISMRIYYIFYTHIGILIRINDIMYISETNPAIEFMPKNGKSTYNTSYDEIRTNNGADILPLLPKLKFFTGDYFIMQLSRPLNQNREELLIQTAKDLFNDNYPYPTLFQGLVAIMGKKIKARHCMLHVAHILDKLQLTLDYEQSGCLSICKKITELSNIKLNDNYYYNNITQILYDI